MDKVIRFYKENKRLISIVASIIGVALFAYSLMSINKETTNKDILIESWISQLPEEHFLNDEKWWAEKELLILQAKLKVAFVSSIKSTDKISVKRMGKIGIVYKINRFFSFDKTNYELKDMSGASVKKVIVSVGNFTKIQLLRDEEELSFILTEDDLKNQALSHDNLVNWIFPRNYVMASVEDTDIATINENFIIGKKKGTTTLRLYIDNQVLAYTINVDS